MNPQIENGYTRIADELLEALSRTRISGEARQIFDTIMRKTYGFNKKMDTISLSQFVLATGISKPHTIRAINKLIDMNLIAKKGNSVGISYGINKRYGEWKQLPKKVTLPKQAKKIASPGKKSLPKKGHTIDTTTIDTFTKEKVWAEWEQYRKEKKSTLTATTKEKQLKKLNGYPVDIATKMLERSMENGWTGIFELKENERQTKTERTAQAIEEGLK